MHTLSWFVIIPALLLSLLGLTMLSSIASDRVAVQALFVTIAILVGWGVFSIGVRNLLFLATPLYAVVLMLVALTAIVGVELRGSRRWLGVGPVRVQTSEFAKPVVLLFVTSAFSRPWSRQRRGQIKKISIATLVFAPLVWLVLRQPDLGSAIVIVCLVASAVLFSGIPRWLLAVALLTVVVLTPFSRFFLKEYQTRRIEVFMDPMADPRGAGYSVIQSVMSTGSGQLLGRGLGHGTQSQLMFLPERQTDFIFASAVEELGLLGGLIIVLLYTVIIVALVRAAMTAGDGSFTIFLGSCATWLFFQTAVNIAMSMGLAPVVGITLPFLSAGGSSLVSSAMMLGLAVSAIESRRDFRYHRTL